MFALCVVGGVDLFVVGVEAFEVGEVDARGAACGDEAGDDFELLCKGVVVGVLDFVLAFAGELFEALAVLLALVDDVADVAEFVTCRGIGYVDFFIFDDFVEGIGVGDGDGHIGGGSLEGQAAEEAHFDGEGIGGFVVGEAFGVVGVFLVEYSAHPSCGDDFVGGGGAEPDVGGSEVGEVLVGIAHILDDGEAVFAVELVEGVEGGM